MVASIVSAMVSDPRFSKAVKEKIGAAVDTTDLELQVSTLQDKLQQVTSTKKRLERQMDSLYEDDLFYAKKCPTCNAVMTTNI